jgi:hypothetical protein
VVDREPYDLLFGERKTPGAPSSAGLRQRQKDADIYVRLLAAEPQAIAERKHTLRTEPTRQIRQSPLYFDLTLSLSKSVSIFHASLGENARLARQAGDQQGASAGSDTPVLLAPRTSPPTCVAAPHGSRSRMAARHLSAKWRISRKRRTSPRALPSTARWMSRSCTRARRPSSRGPSVSRWRRSRRRCGAPMGGDTQPHTRVARMHPAPS